MNSVKPDGDRERQNCRRRRTVQASAGGAAHDPARPALAVILHAIAGLASASFYVPYRGVKGWSWESYWLVGGVFSWVVAPWAFALVETPELFRVLGEAPPTALLLLNVNARFDPFAGVMKLTVEAGL